MMDSRTIGKADAPQQRDDLADQQLGLGTDEVAEGGALAVAVLAVRGMRAGSVVMAVMMLLLS